MDEQYLANILEEAYRTGWLPRQLHSLVDRIFMEFEEKEAERRREGASTP